MRLYRCDRCGKEFNGNEYLVTESNLGIIPPDMVGAAITFPFDMCDGCCKDFENWFRQPSVDKAFEEAYKRRHENGEVTPLSLPDGSFICPVCGYMFDPIKISGVKLSYKTVNKIEYHKSCPKCGSLFNEDINYIDLKKKDDVDYIVRNEYVKSREEAENYAKKQEQRRTNNEQQSDATET